MESTKRNCELITERNKSLSNDIIALQKERSQVEIEKTRLQLELCNMRYDVPTLVKYFNCLH